MLISKRRLQWTAIGLLIVCVLLMLRPTRSWIERVWIAHALSPQLTVGELIVYSKKSVIEVKDLQWHVDGSNFARNTDGGASGHIVGASGRPFGVNARCCWLGIDRHSLPSGKLRLPKVIFQDADLYLAGGPPSANSSLENWRQQLAQQIVDFNCETLQQQLKCLPAIEELGVAWRERIEGWGKRSRQIIVEAAQLEYEVETMDNPLRFAESIKAKFSRFQQLVDEQRSLVGQLDELDGSLADESARLNGLHQQDLLTLAGLSTEDKLKQAMNLSQAEFERELADVLGDAVWNQLAPFGEIVDNISHAAASFRTADYDVTLRTVEYGSEQVQRSELKASGEFQAGLVKSRYQTKGTWRIAQQTPTRTFREFNSVTVFHGDTFHGDKTQLEVSSQYDSRQSTSTQLKIFLAHRRQPTAKQSGSALLANEATEQTLPSQATLTSDAGKLTGSLSVMTNTLKWLAWKLPPELLDSIDAESNQPLLFELSGAWDQPQLTLSDDAPTWLQQAVEKLVIQQARAAIAKSKLQLDSQFSDQMCQLRQLVDVDIREARQVTAADERELLVSQTRMREQLDLINSVEFARRPGEVNR